MPQQRQLAAIMFTDIVGYTALMGNDEHKAFALLQKNRDIHHPVIQEYHGRLIKELGDGNLVTFNTVTDAISAALKIQALIQVNNEFQLRIGIHHGEVIFDADDVFGDVVNIAARIQTITPAGCIYVSESVHHNVLNKKGIVSRYIKQEYLKNVREPINIYQVSLNEGPEAHSEKKTEDTEGSILPGFKYDVYLSFNPNDNKYDGWVNEFISKLKQELNATLKDKLNVHFDRGPLPGHEHHAAPSQKNIQSLIFIPVISQTYCDPQSYAWQEEFLCFKSEINEDKIGPQVILPNGHATSRILPVKIHDIDIDDVRLLERELHGDLRSVDFIYREAGVNRPLRPADDELAMGKTGILYRNQINKLANLIKEVVQGIKYAAKYSGTSGREFSVTPPPAALNNFITSLPPSVQVHVINRQAPNVYLAWTSADLKEQREEMAIILQKAGFNVLPSVDCPADDATFKLKVAENLARCSCSLHMLSGEFGRRFELDEEISFPQYQFNEARQKMQEDKNFHSFVWMYPQANPIIKPAQQEFIKYIRNNITRNMMFSNSAGAMQLVDDMRIVMMKNEPEVLDAKDTDIFFIFNQQDEQDAKIVTDKLSLEYPVEIMNIMPDSADQYREISSQQIPKSKLAVVYFKYAADWALPFIKQIWKEVGGASSPTPLFLVGENDPPTNLARTFKAPKVVSNVVPKEDVPKEVKKVYTAVVELK